MAWAWCSGCDDEATGRIVALKQLMSSLAGAKRRNVEALFEQEYHTLVRLKHPRIIEVYDYGIDARAARTTRWSCSTAKTSTSSASLPYREPAATCATSPRRWR